MARKFYSNFVKAANAAVSPFLADEGSVQTLCGWNNVEKLGALLKELGYDREGDVLQAGKKITGLYDFTQQPGTQKLMATVNDSGDTALNLKYNNAGTWTAIVGATTAWSGKQNAKVDFETFLSYLFMVGYDPTTGFISSRSMNGVTLGTTNLTNAPDAKFIVRYRSRLYMINCFYGATHYPYRVRISPLPSSGALGDWDYTDNFFDVDYGEELTGGAANWDILILFTKRKAYRYDQTQLKELWRVGCSNHRTIKSFNDFLFFADRNGIWVSQNGGRPVNVAGKILPLIKSADSDNFFSEIIDEEYHMYIGDASINGKSYTNTEVIFNIPTSTIRWRELGSPIAVYETYDNAGEDRLYMGGNADGSVWERSKYTDEQSAQVYSDGKVGSTEGVEINALMETSQDPLSDPKKKKRLTSITTFSERAGGMYLMMRGIDDNVDALNEYNSVGEIDKLIKTFTPPNDEFNILQLAVQDKSSLPYTSLFGIMIDYEIVGEEATDK